MCTVKYKLSMLKHFTSFGQNTAAFYDKYIQSYNRALYILARFWVETTLCCIFTYNGQSFLDTRS